MALGTAGASGVVHASKEVILAAGTYILPRESAENLNLRMPGSLQTPQILELSGVTLWPRCAGPRY